MLAYVDTSMLVKRYLPELGSEEFEARLLGERPDLIASEIVHPELASALRRRARQGHIDEQYLMDALDDFDQDVQRRAVRLAPLDTVCVHGAAHLVRRLRAPIATLDSLHLATALEHRCDIIFTNDSQLARAAVEAGLASWPQDGRT